MLNFYKLIEIIVSLQSLVLTTMLPVYIPLPFIDKSNNFELPITWQIPTIILLTLIFERKVVFNAFSIYIFLGLFISPVFHEGGSIGYLLTPNFGYLLGVYPLIKIIDNLSNKKEINVGNFLINGCIGIGAMHITGIIYNLIQTIFYSQFNLFLYNLGKYSLGKIGYHFLMLFPILLLIKPIKLLKHRK
jgi:biotin transport system substrate-specific component